MKRFFHNEQDNFQNRLILMGQKAVEVTRLACKAVTDSDPVLAAEVIKADDAIDELEVEIDREALRYITLRAPVASDLRVFMVGTKVSHDLERVGDEASSIAKRVIRVSRLAPPLVAHEIPDMVLLAVDMLVDAVNAYLEGDDQHAEDIVKRDRIMDEYHDNVFHTLTRHIKENPHDTEACLEYLFIAKSLERIGDHASNLAEEVVYIIRGDDDLRHSSEIKEFKTRDRQV